MLPDTIADRSIPIRLARKRPDEHAERFRRREALESSTRIVQELGSWAQDAVAWLAEARPTVPAVLDDRAEEAWEPLLAIAELAGGDWPERARAAAEKLSGGDDRDDEALGVKLLADIRDAFADAGSDRLSSAALATALGDLEESPWGDLWGKVLDARGLARRLKPFAVRPRTVGFDDHSTAKGYHLEQFADAFSRYLGDSDRHNGTTRTATSFAAISEPSHDEPKMTRKPAPANGCDDVTDETPTQGVRRILSPGEPGYAMWVDSKFVAGDITGSELLELQRISRIIVRGRRLADAA